MTYWYDIVSARRVYQHGDNPEHVTFIDDYDRIQLESVRGVSLDTMFRVYILHKLILWTDRIHEYEQ